MLILLSFGLFLLHFLLLLHLLFFLFLLGVFTRLAVVLFPVFLLLDPGLVLSPATACVFSRSFPLSLSLVLVSALRGFVFSLPLIVFKLLILGQRIKTLDAM